MSLCVACQALSDRWLDSNPMEIFPRPAAPFTSTTARDVSVAGIAERRGLRFEDWRKLVNEQRRGIVENCAAGRHADPR